MTKRFTKVDKRKLQAMIREQPQVVDDGLRSTGVALVADIQLSFNSSPPGRTYGDHVASQPGNPPNVDTGRLRATIRVVKFGERLYRVEDGTEYGYALEVGTRHIKARPFMRPAFKRAQQILIDWLRDKYK